MKTETKNHTQLSRTAVHGKLGRVSGYQLKNHEDAGTNKHEWKNDGSSRPVGSDIIWLNQVCPTCGKRRQVRWTAKRMITRSL